MPRFVVSACLAGKNCRYDGGSNPCSEVIRLVQTGEALPVCPEELGGLPIPRPACEQCGDRIVNKEGNDCTDKFVRGAEKALRLAKKAKCTEAILKARSPSCGVNGIYDGTFSKVIVPADGVFAAMLRRAGFRIRSEDSF